MPRGVEDERSTPPIRRPRSPRCATRAATWARLGVTPMIGVNDVSDEVFTLSDARRVVAFARDHGVGQLSMWSVTRDKRCAGAAGGPARPDCSGVDQGAYAFSRELSAFG